MLIIHHRRNSQRLLQETPADYGVEVDIRSYSGELVVHHDPYVNAIRFESWLKLYCHRLLILNTKEEGLESRLLDLMNQYNVREFFFLDQSFPFLVKTARSGESRCAVRVSEYESIETALTLAGMVQWIWVDVFSRFPLDHQSYKRLKDSGFKLCLVSPELQGHTNDMLIAIQAQMSDLDITMDAVCTKDPMLWLNTQTHGR